MLLPVALVARPLLLIILIMSIHIGVHLHRHLVNIILPCLFLARVVACWQFLKHMIIIDVLALISLDLVLKQDIVVPITFLLLLKGNRLVICLINLGGININ